jgi:hypothetical protein
MGWVEGRVGFYGRQLFTPKPAPLWRLDEYSILRKGRNA